MTERTEVFVLIDGERDYQEKKWPGHAHGAGAYLTYMHHWLGEAIKVDSTLDGRDPEHFMLCHGAIRKFTALAVACMETNGTIARNGYESLGCNARAVIYRIISEERDYQEGGAGGKFIAPRRRHETSELLTMLRRYMRIADEEWTDNPSPRHCLKSVRKLAAIGVRFMELHGAPTRTEPIQMNVVGDLRCTPAQIVAALTDELRRGSQLTHLIQQAVLGL